MSAQFQTQPFSVPMANMNLPPSEALNQIMDNLNHLNIIVNQAINTIHFRIKQESNLLSSISNRVNEAYKKTQLIAQNPNKSTTIYSSTNYPKNKLVTNNDNAVINKPIINKTDLKNNEPIKPKRKNYNLSLNQRQQKPSNIDTVSLLHSIKKKTQNKNKQINEKNDKIPQHVTSIADYMVFDTNCNAYKQSKKKVYDRRRRKKKKEKIIIHLDAAPPSISDEYYYNLKNQYKTYGEKLIYKPSIDRKTMPKYKIHSNAFNLNDGNNNNYVANDIIYKDEINPIFIPSDVINKRDMNIKFEFGDKNVIPPSIHDINDKENKNYGSEKIHEKVEKDEKNEEEEEEKNYGPIHNYPTPTSKLNVVNNDIIDIPDEKIEEIPVTKVVRSMKSKQSVIPEVNAQNNSLQINKKEKEEHVNNKNKVKNDEKKIELKKDDKVDGNKSNKLNKSSHGVLPFDASALLAAKNKLNHKKKDDEERKIKRTSLNPMQQALEDRLKQLRQNVGNEESGSEMSDID